MVTSMARMTESEEMRTSLFSSSTERPVEKITMRFMLESERADSLLRARASTTTSLPSLLCHGHFLERARLQDSDVREARIAIKYLGKLQTRYVAKMDAVRCTKEFVQPCEDASAGARACPGRGAYSARSISAGSIRTAWMTAGNDASSAAATIASDGSASMGRSVPFT